MNKITCSNQNDMSKVMSVCYDTADCHITYVQHRVFWISQLCQETIGSKRIRAQVMRKRYRNPRAQSPLPTVPTELYCGPMACCGAQQVSLAAADAQTIAWGPNRIHHEPHMATMAALPL